MCCVHAVHEDSAWPTVGHVLAGLWLAAMMPTSMPDYIGADFHRAMVATAPGEKTPHRVPPYE